MNRKDAPTSIAVTSVLLVLLLLPFCSEQQRNTRAASSRQKSAPTPAVKSAVETIDSLDELMAIVENTPGKLLVFDLYADWCRPCKLLAPTFAALANDHAKNARFFRVDIEQNSDIAAAFQVRGIPLVVFMKDKTVVRAITGFNPREEYERVITGCGPSVPAEECKNKFSGTL